MIYMHHHLGLGDHIVCNAIVRSVYEKYGSVKLAVKKNNYSSVKQLYRDLDEMEFDQVVSDDECIKNYGKSYIRLGFELTGPWEHSFYDQMGMDYRDRYDKFYIERDYDREAKLEEALDIPEEFCFVCDTTSEQTYDLPITSDLPRVNLRPISDSIFDWIGVLEKAKEIHTVDTSVFHLIKQLQLKSSKFFYDVSRTTPPTFEDSNWNTVIL